MTKREQMAIEQIAKVLKRFEKTSFYPYSSSVTEATSTEILNLTDSEGNKLLAVIAKDQSTPENPYAPDFEPDIQTVAIRSAAYNNAQQDMLKDNWLKIEKRE